MCSSYSLALGQKHIRRTMHLIVCGFSERKRKKAHHHLSRTRGRTSIQPENSQRRCRALFPRDGKWTRQLVFVCRFLGEFKRYFRCGGNKIPRFCVCVCVWIYKSARRTRKVTSPPIMQTSACQNIIQYTIRERAGEAKIAAVKRTRHRILWKAAKIVRACGCRWLSRVIKSSSYDSPVQKWFLCIITKMANTRIDNNIKCKGLLEINFLDLYQVTYNGIFCMQQNNKSRIFKKGAGCWHLTLVVWDCRAKCEFMHSCHSLCFALALPPPHHQLLRCYFARLI